MGPEPGPGALRPAGPGVGASVPASPRLDLATPGPLHPDGRSPTESCAWRRGEVGGGFLHDPLHRPLVPFPSRSGSRRPPPHPKSRPKSLPALRWLLEGPSSLSDPSPGAPSGRPFLSFPLRAPRSPSPELPSAGPGGGGGTPPPSSAPAKLHNHRGPTPPPPRSRLAGPGPLSFTKSQRKGRKPPRPSPGGPR